MAKTDNLLITYKVLGGFKDEHDYIPSRLTQFEVTVWFSHWTDFEKETRNYLNRHNGPDIPPDSSEWSSLLNNWNCAKALAVDYVQRARFRVLHVESAVVLNRLQIPQEPPLEEKENVRIWATETEKEIFTATNAGWELWSACSRHGKISVADAHRLVRDKFPNESFNWNDVLEAFRKNGGKHTDLYLRKD